MANLFDVYKVFRPGTTILSDDFNSFQSALVGAFQKLGTTRADNLTGVEEPFSVGTPTAATHAVRKDYYESSVNSLSAAAVAGELASQVAAADSSASDSANSATASANSATDSLGYFQAAQALDTIMPSGTTNSTMRYNGSNWAETDKLQIDSAGVVTATAGLRSTGAGTDSFRAGKLAGETNQGNNGIIISAKGSAVNDDTDGHIHIASDEASLDYTNADGWSATDSSGSFPLRGGSSAFPDKPLGEPIVIVFTGQSNCSGVNVNSSMVTNSSVFDWQTTAPSSGYPQTGTFAFAVANPSWNSGYANQQSTQAFTGMRGSGNDGFVTGSMGNIGWTAADLLQKQTGRDVYMITVHQGAATINAWASGGTCATRLNTQVVAALAAVPSGPAKPDLVIWAQGESDSTTGILGSSPESYFTAWNTFKVASEAVWTEKDKTRWLVCGLGSYWETTQGYWAGLKLLIQNTSQYVNFIPSEGAQELILGHFSGLGYEQMGERVREAVVAGNAAKPIQNYDSKSIVWQGTSTTIQLAPLATTSAGPVGVTIQGRSATAAAVAGQQNGGDVSIIAGSGEVDGNGGNTVISAGALAGTGSRGSTLISDVPRCAFNVLANNTAESPNNGGISQVKVIKACWLALLANGSGVTFDAANGTMTCVHAGTYAVNFYVSEATYGQGNETLTIYVDYAGAFFRTMVASPKVDSSGYIPPFSMSNQITLTAGQVIYISYWATGTVFGALLIKQGGFNIQRISN